ncbi:MAG: nitrilase [Methanoculleus sp. SDB]|nr:MAG: nitrilase [Methanoculleus sp. SDB]
MCPLLCSAQIKSVWNSPEKTLSYAERAFTVAARARADLICFPEQFATGWDPAAATHIEDENGIIVSRLRDLACRYEIAVLGSFREAHAPLPRNTAIAIGPDGSILARYAKIHLFSPGGEHKAFSPGEESATFSVAGMRFGIAICYDLRFPELFTAYSRAGVDAVLVPAAWPCRRIAHWELLIRARALENQFFVAGTCTTGKTPVEQYCGHSIAAGPDGEILSRAGDGILCMLTALDTAAIREARAALPIHSDRRDDIYMRMREIR